MCHYTKWHSKIHSCGIKIGLLEKENGGVIVKKCTQCSQILSDDTKFCFKCGGGNYEPVIESGGDYQQPTYQQPSQQPQPQQSYYTQQPAYQQPAAYQTTTTYQQSSGDRPVSIGMYILFFILSAIPLVNLIFAIVVAASSGFQKSYRNLAKAWLILLVIGIVLSIVLSIALQGFFESIVYNLQDLM